MSLSVTNLGWPVQPRPVSEEISVVEGEPVRVAPRARDDRRDPSQRLRASGAAAAAPAALLECAAVSEKLPTGAACPGSGTLRTTCNLVVCELQASGRPEVGQQWTFPVALAGSGGRARRRCRTVSRRCSCGQRTPP